ncbi:MAG: phosphatidate cytidylyltransferase [Thermoguttaceae bacterium]
MLSRRLLVGFFICAAILFFSYWDVRLSQYGYMKEIVWLPRGIVLFPIYCACLVFLTREVLRILNASGLHPLAWTVYLGNLLIAISCWLANVFQQYKLDILNETTSKGGWQWASTASFVALLAVAVGVMLSFFAEMRRYSHPGGVTINLAGSVFAICYLGLLSCFIIQLHMAYEIWATLSLALVTKLSDTGAFTIGKLFGRTKLTPGISPGKTIEGAVGGLFFACIGAWFWFDIMLPLGDHWKLREAANPTPIYAWLLFGICVALAGMIGDLAGSLIKRDSYMKDSGHSVPGFGGVLDLFDSLLMAAPVVYVFWALGIVSPGKHL